MENLAPAVINCCNSSSDDGITEEAWKAKFIEYYTTNAPTKVSLVNEKMMAKYRGKYHVLMKNLINKYGPLGEPSTKNAASTAFSSLSVSTSIDDHSLKFAAMIDAATPSSLPPRNNDINVVESKTRKCQNGLETSTFTVCTRVRPLLGSELKANNYAAVVPGHRTSTATTPTSSIHDDAYTEELRLFTPKLSITGKAKLDTMSHDFDYVFGPNSTNDEIYNLACAPLVERALNGQVGVIFAYGQTGSGKTHTISGILNILSTSAIWSTRNTITFSYIEMLGRDISDCLPSDAGGDTAEGTKIQIGEGLNGAVLIRNMTTHTVRDADQFASLIQRANATRSTAVTAKNQTSSRSHGVAIIKVTNKKTGVEGSLYVIDLAGSESAKDSKDHDATRMKETKEINSSLMTLKSCIRARTTAAGVGQGDTHIPYRSNKLTLLMKDIFDVGCSRLCSTVVIATCSPLVSDISHTKNTVKYAAPLRVAIAAASSSKGSGTHKGLELDALDPALWDNEQIVSWVESNDTSGKIDAKLFVNSLTGVQFCALSENVFYERTFAQAGQLGEEEEDMKEIAKTLYLGLWTLIVDAKTRKRRPDGSIITPEQEEEERRVLEEETIERAKLWAEREKYM